MLESNSSNGQSGAITTVPFQGIWVICLCADWCGLCRDYGQLFSSMSTRYPDLRFVWLDIEDQSDLVGELDVETFPTLLIANDQGTRFLGPLTPHADTLSRLLDSLGRADQGVTPHQPATQLLLKALDATPEHWIAP